MTTLTWLTDRPRWQDLSLCSEVDTELFFAEKGASSTVREAKSICRRCDVESTCLEWALETREQFGVLGGKTARERRGMLARTEPDAA